MHNPEDAIARRIHDMIENELMRAGLLFRVFFRAKTKQSIDNKISKNKDKYSSDGKKIQDLYGIRVALYFSDDSVLAQNAIKNIFTYDHKSSSIDSSNIDKFAATRCNLIFILPDELAEESQVISTNNLVDKTFEVQFRTILSEGWHEVDHDLRYKCNQDWTENQDLSRALNGIYASLETSDWSMLKLFEDLAYKHYKAQRWNAMVRHKFRLRFTAQLSKNIEELISNENLGKSLYRVNRDDFLKKLYSYKLNIPINMNNIIYLCNLFYFNNQELSKLTPVPIARMYNEAIERLND